MQNSREAPLGGGSWGCCSLLGTPLNPTALSYADCRKLLSESVLNGQMAFKLYTVYLSASSP